MQSSYYPYTHKTQYYETDQMGVIHNSNYFRWFEEARTDFMERVGLPYAKMEEMGLRIAVMDSACSYKAPVRYGDEAIVEQRIIFFNGYKMTIRYRVFRKSDHALCALGETRYALLSADWKPVRLTKERPEIYELFAGYALPFEADEDEAVWRDR